jgi:hypothetical protein
MALRRPPAPSRAREAGAAVAGLSLGLAFHLLLIPIAARHPSFMVEDPSDLSSWWSYVSLDMKGGGFLFHIFPRTADFLRVQVSDYVAFLAHNLWELFFLPAALIAWGWLAMAREHPRRALGLLVFFLCAGPGAVVYFNLPQAYFRPIDRHYLPSLVILAPWMAVGASALLRRAARARFGSVWAAGLAILLGLAPLLAWSANRSTCDLSRNRFAESIGRDLLEPLPERAILITNGDNDSFPPWYLQQAEGVRADVTVVNLPLSNERSYVSQVRRSDPDLAGLLAGEPARGLVAAPPAPDSTLVIPVEPAPDTGLPEGAALPDSLALRVKDTLFGQDRVVLDLVQLVRWRRPIFLACTVSPDNLAWIRPLARLDGLAYRIVPSEDPRAWDVDHARRQMERVSYAGFADRSVSIDITTSLLMQNYVSALLQIAGAEVGLGHLDHAREVLALLDRRIPRDRLGQAAGQFAEMRAGVEAEIARRSAR